MKLFLDCEFNGFGGELLSIALVPEAGDAFYRIVSDTKETPSKWVAENVIPILGSFRGRDTKTTRAIIRAELQVYLMEFAEIHVVADWPEDIMHFCRLLLTDVPGQRINTPPLTMEIVRIDAESELPHNALADAVGIRAAYIGQPKPVKCLTEYESGEGPEVGDRVECVDPGETRSLKYKRVYTVALTDTSFVYLAELGRLNGYNACRFRLLSRATDHVA